MIYKIAFFLPHIESKGGVQVSVNTIVKYLRERGHEVHLFPVGKTNIKDGSFVHPINTNKRNERIRLIKVLFSQLEVNREFDVVITNTKPTTELVYTLNIPSKQLIVLRQSSFIRKHFLARLSYRLTYKKYYNHRHIATITECLKENFIERFNYLSPKSISVLYNSFDAEDILNHAEEEKEIKRLAEPYIVSVGRLVKGKNTIELLRAFEQCENKSIHLVILGEGKERKNLENFVFVHNLQERVHFLGWINNPYPYIKNAKLLVHTSKYETFGRVLLEALALKTPVVSFDIQCGPKEILTGVLSPFLVPYNNTQKLSEMIDQALTSYPDIDSSIMEKFRIENIGEQYLKRIETIVRIK